MSPATLYYINVYYCACTCTNYINLQVVKDWHLLMVVLLIAMMEIIIAAPLLTLALLKGDVAAVTNTEPTLNVSTV